MAQENPSYVIQASSHPAYLFRQAAQSMIPGNAGGSGGVIGSGDLAVTPLTGTNMYISIAPGQLWIPGTLGSTTGMPYNSGSASYPFTSQGLYFGYSDAALTSLYCAAASGTQNRIDNVIAQQADAYYSGSTNAWSISIQTGTNYSGTPTAPTPPASSIVLAQISVPAATTAITTGLITDTRPHYGRIPLGVIQGTGNQSLANGTYTQLTFSNASLLYGGMSFGSNSLTVPVAGIYDVIGTVATNSYSGVSGSNTYIQSDIIHNGTGILSWTLYPIPDGSTTGPAIQIFTPVVCAAGDTLGMQVANFTGQTQTTSSTNGTSLYAKLTSQ